MPWEILASQQPLSAGRPGEGLCPQEGVEAPPTNPKPGWREPHPSQKGLPGCRACPMGEGLPGGWMAFIPTPVAAPSLSSLLMDPDQPAEERPLWAHRQGGRLSVVSLNPLCKHWRQDFRILQAHTPHLPYIIDNSCPEILKTWNFSLSNRHQERTADWAVLSWGCWQSCNPLMVTANRRSVPTDSPAPTLKTKPHVSLSAPPAWAWHLGAAHECHHNPQASLWTHGAGEGPWRMQTGELPDMRGCPAKACSSPRPCPRNALTEILEPSQKESTRGWFQREVPVHDSRTGSAHYVGTCLRSCLFTCLAVLAQGISSTFRYAAPHFPENSTPFASSFLLKIIAAIRIPLYLFTNSILKSRLL